MKFLGYLSFDKTKSLMWSSSENSFAWTDTSSDSINSTFVTADNIDDKSKRINSITNKMKIKTESDGDNDVRKKKKKKKYSETNEDQNDTLDLMQYDETYLNNKVKHEALSASLSTKHKKKKRKRTSSIESLTSLGKSYENNSSSIINNENIKQVTENDAEISKSKKKKKSKKQHDINNRSLDREEKMEIDKTMETVVNKQKLTSENTNVNTHSFVIDNTLQESEESGCGEISAIKCDDSHSAHTISFINKSIQEENTQVNYCNDSKIISKLASIEPDRNSNTNLIEEKHRKKRLSDRIRFEDDDDDTKSDSSHVSHSENNKKSLKLKHFHKGHPNLKLIPSTYNNDTNLTRDDEAWILKCPSKIDITDFNDTTLNIHVKCKIKVGGQTYEGSIEEEQSDTKVSLLKMEHRKYKIRNVPVSGIINLRNKIPKAHFRDDNIMVNNQTNFIPLPDTKCRHPLFGSNYKKALKIPAEIVERLNVQDSHDTLIRPAKRKKKNKKEKISSEQVNTQMQSDILMKTEPDLPVKLQEKKKKKRKITDDEGPAPKKVKRFKQDPESAEAWESEKAIEENLFNF